MQQSDARVNDESKKFLQEVKKGKPRKFVMIKEGVEIDRLYIFKKGPFDRYVRMAKQDGVRGEAFWGTVTGNGLDIRFELSRADGFTTPPSTQIRLKEFIKQATGFKFDPDYVIVDAPTVVDETDESAEGGEIGSADDTAVAGETQTAPTEEAGEKFIRLLKSILPHVKRALATSTSVSTELQASVREAQDFGRKRDFQNGMESLRRVGALTKQALAEAEKPSAAVDKGADARSPASRRKEAEEKRRREWNERIAQIEPQFEQAMSAATLDTSKLQIVMNYARRQSKRRQYVKALVGLDRLEKMLAAEV